MVPNGSQNPTQTDPKEVFFPHRSHAVFFKVFCHAFWLFLEVPDPRFNCYLQHIRRVGLFSHSTKTHQKLTPKIHQTCIKNYPKTCNKNTLQNKASKWRKRILKIVKKLFQKAAWAAQGAHCGGPSAATGGARWPHGPPRATRRPPDGRKCSTSDPQNPKKGAKRPPEHPKWSLNCDQETPDPAQKGSVV